MAREGAAAAQTVASGPSLVQGMAGVVYEQQVLSTCGTCSRHWLDIPMKYFSHFKIYFMILKGHIYMVVFDISLGYHTTLVAFKSQVPTTPRQFSHPGVVNRRTISTKRIVS